MTRFDPSTNEIPALSLFVPLDASHWSAANLRKEIPESTEIRPDLRLSPAGIQAGASRIIVVVVRLITAFKLADRLICVVITIGWLCFTRFT